MCLVPRSGLPTGMVRDTAIMSSRWAWGQGCAEDAENDTMLDRGSCAHFRTRARTASSPTQPITRTVLPGRTTIRQASILYQRCSFEDVTSKALQTLRPRRRLLLLSNQKPTRFLEHPANQVHPDIAGKGSLLVE